MEAVDIDGRALIRLQADHVNRTLVPSFYRYLQAQDSGKTCSIYQLMTSLHDAVCTSEKQIEGGKEFLTAIEGLVQLFERAEKESESKVGLWHADGKLSLADAMAGPCEQTPERT
jgi:glutathione S-transferase